MKEIVSFSAIRSACLLILSFHKHANIVTGNGSFQFAKVKRRQAEACPTES
jgi:hypothetical protein